MKVHIGIDKDAGPINQLETTSANVHDLPSAAELIYGRETLVYADSGYQWIEEREK